MHRRVVSLMWMLFFAAIVSQAATLTFNPASPHSAEPVGITVLYQACSPFLETSVTPPTATANGKIRIDILDVCACVATPPPTPPLHAELAPLAVGTYTTELYFGHRDGACTSEGTLLETGSLVSSVSGAFIDLRTEPAEPTPGQPVNLVITTSCPLAWKPPVFETQGGERLILVDFNPLIPPPPIACSDQHPFESRVSLGSLEAGVYQVRVSTGFVPGPITVPPVPEAELIVTVTPPESSLLFQNNRFRVRAIWDSPEFGPNEAQAVQLTQDSGYFWFSDPNNVELVAKVLNGCGVNNRYWVFLAGLTNVGVTVTVDDTLTGETQSYTNALGQPFLPVQDTDAFAGCQVGDPR